LSGTGGASVVWTDGHGGPPYLDVLDHMGWWRASTQASPHRLLMSTDAGPDPVGQLADGRCSGGQIATPHLMFLEVLRDGR
jgi:hypothetical protein